MTNYLTAYQKLSADYPGMLLLFRNGDSMEAMFEHAITISRTCGLELSSRGGSALVTFPAVDLERHLRTLLRAGHRVAVCERVEDTTKTGQESGSSRRHDGG